MAYIRLNSVLQHVRHLAGAGAPAGAADGELVERFAAGREEGAFAELVWRHGPMVLGVCRNVLGREHDAEDAFQATFLVLAKRAGSIRKRDSVASWLHGVAYRLAQRARVERARRQVHERRAAAMRTKGPDVERALREVQEGLHRALESLPERYRAALVLCHLEGRSHEEAARQLGCPLATLRSRLTRGRKLLRDRLAGGGSALPVGALTAVLALGGPAGARCGPLLRVTVRAALRFAAGWAAADAAPAGAAALVEGALKSMVTTKLAAATALLLATALLAGAGLTAYQAPAGNHPDAWAEGGQPAAEARRPGPPVDLVGDPLPPGAIARMGTTRLRQGDGVFVLALSPDGKTAASAGRGDIVRVWDVATGRELCSFSGDWRTTRAIAFAPDGKLIATGSDAGKVYLWEAATAKLVLTINASENAIRCVTFAPDGRSVAAAGPGRLPGVTPSPGVTLWDVATGKTLRRFECREGPASAVAFAPDGKTLAGGCDDKTARLWDVATGQELKRLRPGDDILSVAFAPDGKTLVVRSPRGRAGVWVLATGREAEHWLTREGRLVATAFAPDGKAIALCRNEEPIVYLCDAATGKELRRFEGHVGPEGATCVAFSADGKRLVSGGCDGVVQAWDVATGRPAGPTGGTHGFVGPVAFSGDGKILLSAGQDQRVRFWDVATGREVQRLADGAAVGRTLALSPDHRTLATCTLAGEVRLWDAITSRPLRRLGKHGSNVYGLSFAPDSRLLASAGKKAVVLWDVATGREVARQESRGGTVAPAFSPDGKVMAFASDQRTVCLWDVAARKAQHSLDSSEGRDLSVTAVAFAPDGRALATVNHHGTVCLWDAVTGQELQRWAGRGPFSNAVAFAPDGRTLATADRMRGEMGDELLRHIDSMGSELSILLHVRKVKSGATGAPTDEKSFATVPGLP